MTLYLHLSDRVDTLELAMIAVVAALIILIINAVVNDRNR